MYVVHHCLSYTSSIHSLVLGGSHLVPCSAIILTHFVFIHFQILIAAMKQVWMTAAGCHTPGDTADLLSVAGEDGLLFGIHRWLIMGPARSGSNVHVDPLGMYLCYQ